MSLMRGALVFVILLLAVSGGVYAQDELVQCPGFLPSRLEIGGNGEVLSGPQLRNNVRVEATVDSLVVGKINPAEPFYVLDGPVCGENAAWWLVVTYQGVTGWTAEGQADLYFKRPATVEEIVPASCAGMTEDAAYAYTTARQHRGAMRAYTCLIEASGDVKAEFYYNRAWSAYNLGEYAPAQSDLTQTLELDTQYVLAYNLRGLIHTQQGDMQGALQDFNRAIEIDPSTPFAHGNRASILYDMGQYEEALASYNIALEDTAQYDADDLYSLYYNRGLTYEGLEEYAEAVNDYTSALTYDANSTDLYTQRGISYSFLGDEQAALADFEQAVELSPEDPMVVRNRGFMYFNLGEYDKALADYNRTIELNPEYVEAYNSRALVYQQQGDLDAALADFDEALRLNPDYVRGYVNRGLLYSDQGEREQAIADFSRAIEIVPNEASNYVTRGYEYYLLGEYNTAIEDYNQALALNPAYPDVLYYRGLAYDDLGMDAEALEDYNDVLALNQGDNLVSTLINRGNIYYAAGDYDKALVDYDAALFMQPDEPYAHYNRGLVFFNLGRYDEAVDEYTFKLEAHPDDAFAWGERGKSYYYLGDLENALSDLNQAIELDPEYQDAYVHRAYVARDNGENEAALEDFNLAAELMPDDSNVYLQRGYVYSLLEQYDDAIADYTRSLELYDDQWVYLYRADAYEQAGDIESALKDIDAVLAMDENFADAYLTRASIVQDDTAAVDYYKWITLNEVEREPAQVIAAGDVVEVEIEQGKVFEFTFRARKGVTITFETVSDSTSVDPLLVVLNSDGEPIMASDDIDEENEDFNGRIEFTPEQAGTYTLILSLSGAGGSGPVQLTVE